MNSALTFVSVIVLQQILSDGWAGVQCANLSIHHLVEFLVILHLQCGRDAGKVMQLMRGEEAEAYLHD